MAGVTIDTPQSGPADPVSQAVPRSPPPHPLLHPDIFPLVLSYASDRTLAHLMRVSRSVLAEIVNLRWPIITYDASNRQTIIRSRTSLPEHPHRFSAAMQVLLTHYARVVRIQPHADYTCPPRIIAGLPKPLAKTVMVDARSLCHSFRSIPESPNGYAPTSFPKSCELYRRFAPTTLRIDGIMQHPGFPLPHGLGFASSLTRVVLCIDPKTPASPYPPATSSFVYSLPAHITEVVFLLAQPAFGRYPEPTKKAPAVTLEELSSAMAEYLLHNRVREDRTLVVVGSERLGRKWLPEPEDGAEEVTVQAAIRQGMAEVVCRKRPVEGQSMVDRVQFVTLQEYLAKSQTRSELTAEEISVMAEAETVRLAKVKRRRRERDSA